MGTGWDHAKDMSKKHAEAGGLFVQLKDHGDKIVGVFCGDPYAREVVWTDEEGYEPYDPERHVGKRPSLRVALNFFVVRDGAMKIVEGGSQWFKSILAVRAKFPLDQWAMEIERQGGARDPKTQYVVLPDQQLDAATRAKIAAIPLHDLERLLRNDDSDPKPRTAAPAPAASAAPPTTIDQATALALVERLKQLPRSNADAFLKEFAIARIRDVPASKAAAADRFIAELEKAHRAPAEEVDPFA